MEFNGKELKYKSDSYQLIHAGKQKLICVICDKHYASKQRQEYERHVTIHKETPDIPCSTCGKLFRSEGYLKIHEKSHVDASFKCHICSLECVTNISLNKDKKLIWKRILRLVLSVTRNF